MGILPQTSHSHTTYDIRKTYYYYNLFIQKVKGYLMNEAILTEFSIYYKRIIRIEYYLKHLIYEKYLEIHKSKAYLILYKTYFSRLGKRSSFNDNRFNEINLKKKSDSEKLILSISKMYISEVLSLFNHKAYLKDRVRKIFFNKPVKTNKEEFKNISKSLKDFRNCICHFDTRQFAQDKKKFTNALLYFEKLLDCRYKYTNGAIEAIEHKLSVKSILELIYQNNPEYFDNDRVLVNVFDDIALLAGYRTDNLPQYKSIIRSKFKIEENARSTQTVYETDSQKY